MNLNDNQLKAVNKTEGPLRIVAGPGSGKTRTIVSKIVHILNNNLAKPEEILAISFTNKAANEIKTRVQQDGGSNVRNIYTYHGWCNYFLRVEAEAIGLSRDFTILDANDTKNRINNLIKEYDFDVEKNDVVDAFEKISREELKIKNLKESEYSAHVQIAELWERYSNEKKVNGQLDFNDLITEVKKLLVTNDYIKEKWSNKYKYIFIDEFQDTNNVQFEIIRAITNPESNLTVVGDPDQNIYSWRGANIDLINNFNEWYPNAETIYLDINYRSTPDIVYAANALIKNNKNRVNDFFSKPEKEYGTPIQFIDEETEMDEAFAVARKIESLRVNGNDLSDIAVIVRFSYKTRSLETAFNHMNVPYKVIGAMKFFDRAEVKQTLKFLLFSIKQDNMTLLDVINNPPKKFGPKKVVSIKASADEVNQTMWDYLRENREKQPSNMFDWINTTEKMIDDIARGDEPSNVLEDYMNEIGYINKLYDEPNRVENISETIRLIRSGLSKVVSKDEIKGKILDFYNSSVLSSAADKELDQGHVNIITAHSSKGTEFPFVFLYSFNEGHWPSSRAEENGELEEERRVAYVAATRAMEHLIISSNDGQQRAWGSVSSDKSRFLDELLNKYQGNQNVQMSFAQDNTLRNDQHKIGDRVFHNTFGYGNVIGLDEDFINIEFDDGSAQEILIGHKSYRKVED